jgi:hypothetical protein
MLFQSDAFMYTSNQSYEMDLSSFKTYYLVGNTVIYLIGPNPTISQKGGLEYAHRMDIQRVEEGG